MDYQPLTADVVKAAQKYKAQQKKRDEDGEDEDKRIQDRQKQEVQHRAVRMRVFVDKQISLASDDIETTQISISVSKILAYEREDSFANVLKEVMKTVISSNTDLEQYFKYDETGKEAIKLLVINLRTSKYTVTLDGINLVISWE